MQKIAQIVAHHLPRIQYLLYLAAIPTTDGKVRLETVENTVNQIIAQSKVRGCWTFRQIDIGGQIKDSALDSMPEGVTARQAHGSHKY